MWLSDDGRDKALHRLRAAWQGLYPDDSVDKIDMFAELWSRILSDAWQAEENEEQALEGKAWGRATEQVNGPLVQLRGGAVWHYRRVSESKTYCGREIKPKKFLERERSDPLSRPKCKACIRATWVLDCQFGVAFEIAEKAVAPADTAMGRDGRLW